MYCCSTYLFGLRTVFISGRPGPGLSPLAIVPRIILLVNQSLTACPLYAPHKRENITTKVSVVRGIVVLTLSRVAPLLEGLVAYDMGNKVVSSLSARCRRWKGFCSYEEREMVVYRSELCEK